MRKPRSESQIPKHWLTKARADLGSAEILFREHGPTDTVCFLCQQAVEKYLKGFLILKKKKFGRIHDLAALLALCGEVDKEFLDWYEQAEKLTGYYIETRYPSDIPVSYSRQEAQEAIKIAKEMIAFVEKKKIEID